MARPRSAPTESTRAMSSSFHSATRVRPCPARAGRAGRRWRRGRARAPTRAYPLVSTKAGPSSRSGAPGRAATSARARVPLRAATPVEEPAVALRQRQRRRPSVRRAGRGATRCGTSARRRPPSSGGVDGHHVDVEHLADGGGDLGEGRGQVDALEVRGAEARRQEAHAVVHVLAPPVGLLDLLVGGDERHGALLHQAGQLAPVVLELADRLVEGQGGPHRLVLHHVEAGGHLAELVGRAHDHRLGRHRGVGPVEVVAGHGLHGRRQLGQRALGQVLGGRLHLVGGVGDHARQDQADRDGEQPDDHEDVLQHGHQGGVAGARRGRRRSGSRSRRAPARPAWRRSASRRSSRFSARAPDRLRSPWARQRVGQRAGEGQAQAEDHDGQAELLEAEDGGGEPHHGGGHARGRMDRSWAR